jgi:hypothetical protein
LDDEWLRELAAAGRAAAGVVGAPTPPTAPAPPLPASLPSSPAALLALIRSPAWQAAAEAREASLAASHVVFGEGGHGGGCPWLVDRPLYAVALPPPAGPSASTSGAVEPGPSPGGAFTLRVRVERGEAAAELDALLAADRAARQGAGGGEGKKKKKGPPRISASSLLDGIIVFACEAHAEAFAGALPHSTAPPAGTAQVGAHDLFRAAAAASAVVVFVRPPPPPGMADPAAYIGPDTFEEGWCPPDPADLAAALRANKGRDGRIE